MRTSAMTQAAAPWEWEFDWHLTNRCNFFCEYCHPQIRCVLNRKHLGWGALKLYGGAALRAASRGQTNYLRMLWKFSTVYNTERQYADHLKPVRYEMKPPRPLLGLKPTKQDLYIHMPAPVH